MSTLAAVLVGITALVHGWFLILEMFLWSRPLGLRTFRLTPETAVVTATLAANQGLYNGFLAAGLALSFIAPAQTAFDARLFLLGCVVVAGVFGTATVSRRILLIQALPGALALIAVVLAGAT